MNVHISAGSLHVVFIVIGVLVFPTPAAFTQVTVIVYSVNGSRFTSCTDSVSELTFLVTLLAE